MKFKKSKGAPKVSALSPGTVGAITTSDVLFTQFKDVCYYVRGAHHCVGRNLENVLREWARLGERDASGIPPALISTCQTTFPGAAIAVVTWKGIACILIDEQPILFVPAEFGSRPFRLTFDDLRFDLTATTFTRAPDVMTKTRFGALCPDGLFREALVKTRAIGAFSSS